MDHSSPIAFLADLARKKRDDAASTLAHAQLRCQEAESRLALLQTYLGEYYDKRRGAQSTSVMALANSHAFTNKLELAITRQKVDVAETRRRLGDARGTYEAAVQHCRAVELLQERRDQARDASAARQLQKQHDELAARMATTTQVNQLAMAV